MCCNEHWRNSLTTCSMIANSQDNLHRNHNHDCSINVWIFYRLFDKQFEPNVLKNQLHGFAKEKKRKRKHTSDNENKDDIIMCLFIIKIGKSCIGD